MGNSKTAGTKPQKTLLENNHRRTTMSAHNTIIQFLHMNQYYEFTTKMHYSGCWCVKIDKSDGRYWLGGSGESYEAACANLVQKFPKP